MRYLGVTLITSKLKYQDGIPLIEKITARISSWASKTLSFAGKLQLIQSAPFSIQAFWCNVFILLKRLLKQLTEACLLSLE